MTVKNRYPLLRVNELFDQLDCKATISTASTQRGQVVNQKVLTSFKCGRKEHYMSDFPKLKDQNCGNKTRNKSRIGEASRKSYVLGRGDANPDSNVITDVSYAFELSDGRVSDTNTVLRGYTLGATPRTKSI
nr:hypothetical protein [Tanacetum cinerariifolium]